jgi:hypothetical protein
MVSSSSDARALVVTWASGGNLPPLLAAAQLLSARGFFVHVLTSQATRAAASTRGFATLAYRRAPEPDLTAPFETQAAQLSAQAAGTDLARDVLEVVQETAADLLVVDCMLPAALAAGEAAGLPTVSVVHFPYALARSVMTRRGGAISWAAIRSIMVTRSGVRREDLGR